PIDETLRALDELVQQGKVRYIGCSNLSAQQVIAAQDTASRLGLAAFVSCQDEYSLLERDIERELIPTAKALGLGILPYFPLASGLLTGKYRRAAAGLAACQEPSPRAGLHQRAQLAHRRRTRSLCPAARPYHARTRVRLAA